MTTDPASEFVPEWTDGDKLRKVRRHLGLSQEEFAERIQVKAPTYMAWESDRNRVKDMRAIARRIKAMTGTPLWWWFDTERPESGEPPPDGGNRSHLGESNPRPIHYLDSKRKPIKQLSRLAKQPA